MRVPPLLIVVALVAGWRAARELPPATMTSLPPLLTSRIDGRFTLSEVTFVRPSFALVLATGVTVGALIVLSVVVTSSDMHSPPARGPVDAR